MLSFPALCFVALVGFLVLCAAFVLFLDRKERERDSPPILDSTDHPSKRLVIGGLPIRRSDL
jgi:hypothetical protein